MAERNTAKRRRALADILMADGSVQITALADRFQVSRETIRKDLIFLEQSGIGTRSRGGSLVIGSAAESPLTARCVENVEKKRAIARAALELVPDGGTLLLDSGSTINEFARLLCQRSGLTIITNSAQIPTILAGTDNTVLTLGGQLRPLSMACVGMWTLSTLQTLRADLAVIGSNGLLHHTGPCTSIYSEAEVKKVMLQRANRSVVLCDSSKFSEECMIQIADWSQISCFVTDAAAPQRALDEIRRTTRVLVARP